MSVLGDSYDGRGEVKMQRAGKAKDDSTQVELSGSSHSSGDWTNTSHSPRSDPAPDSQKKEE